VLDQRSATEESGPMTEPSASQGRCLPPTSSASDTVMLPAGMLNIYPRESDGICFYRRWFVCVSVCLSVKTITKKSVDGFVPNFREGS